jgi:Beta-ketoacyl synthase, N-terminal domain
MSRSDISIRAVGDYHERVADAPPDLRTLTKDVTGKQVRRVGRFIQMGLIGAARCVGNATLPPDTAVYLTSRRGDLEVTIEVMQELFRDGHAPKPLSFINTVSNAACYYIARHFELHGRSCFVGGAHFAFETALDLAVLEMRAGVVKSALVGCIEIATEPLGVHRQRLGLAPDAAVAEASHWLWLDARDERDALGSVGGVEFFTNAADLAAWFARQRLDPGATAFCQGQFLADSEGAAIQRELGLQKVFNYRTERGYYDCQSGALVGAFLQGGGDGACAVLHVNGNPDGRLAVMLARR